MNRCMMKINYREGMTGDQCPKEENAALELRTKDPPDKSQKEK